MKGTLFASTTLGIMIVHERTNILTTYTRTLFTYRCHLLQLHILASHCVFIIPFSQLALGLQSFLVHSENLKQ